MPNYWLMKSEPSVYSLDNLRRDRTTWWEGVRNYQARNFMSQQMKPGDGVLFYHSNADPSGVAGLAEVSKPAAPDATARDPRSEYYDPKASDENPIWLCVQVRFQELFKHFVPLEELKKHAVLKNMAVVKKGSRLSVHPVTAKEFAFVVSLGRGR